MEAAGQSTTTYLLICNNMSLFLRLLLYRGRLVGRARQVSKLERDMGKCGLFSYCFSLGFLIALNSWGVEDSTDPRTTVALATTQIMKIVRDASSYYNEDPEKYYMAIENELDTFVDFRGFARGVMGKYATGSRYRALNKDEKKELRAQLDKFTKVIRESLVRTYSKGLLAFGGSRIELDPGVSGAVTESAASVKQLIYGENTEPYVVVYQMRKMNDKSWKLRNMIVEGVNLGKIFRNQFETSVNQFDGDLDQAILNWIAVNE